MHGNTTVLRGILCNKTVTTTLLYVGIFIEQELKVISYKLYELYVCNTWVSTALNYRYHTIDARGKLQSLTQWWWLRRWLWQWLMTSLLIPKRVCACFCVCKYHVCHCFFQPFPADLWPIQVRRWLPVHCVQCREHFGLRDHPPLTGWPVGRSQWVVHSVDMYKDGQAPGTSPTLWKKLKSRNTHILKWP